MNSIQSDDEGEWRWVYQQLVWKSLLALHSQVDSLVQHVLQLMSRIH
jgi:hypothetical protein